MKNPCEQCIVKAMCKKPCANHIDYVSTTITEYNFKSYFYSEISFFIKNNRDAEFLFFDGVQVKTRKSFVRYKSIRLIYNNEGEILSIARRDRSS